MDGTGLLNYNARLYVAIVPTQWGGDTEYIKVSARANTGIQDLLETILLVAELGNLQSRPQRRATGTIVEAEMDRNRGPIATYEKR